LEEKVIISQKPPKVFDRELKKKRIEMILVESVDLGRLMTEVVADNADKIAKALGIEFDDYQVRPASHPPWVRDITFYKGNKVVLEIEVKTVSDPERLRSTIRRIIKEINLYKVIGVLAIGAGYRKKGETRDDLGLLMIVLTPEYVRRKSVEDIVDDINLELTRKRIAEGYERLYLVAFRDKFIMRAVYAQIQMEKKMATKEDLKALESKMATKEDLAKFATKEDLKALESKILKRFDKLYKMLQKILEKEKG